MIGTDHLLSKKLKTFSICNAKVSNSYLSNAKVSKSVASANFSDPNKPSLSTYIPNCIFPNKFS